MDRYAAKLSEMERTADIWRRGKPLGDALLSDAFKQELDYGPPPFTRRLVISPTDDAVDLIEHINEGKTPLRFLGWPVEFDATLEPGEWRLRG